MEKVQPPKISIETQKRMHAFFMKTSAPRLYAKMKEAERIAEEQKVTHVKSE